MKRSPAALALCLVSVFLPGCGGSSKSNPGGPSPTPSAAPVASVTVSVDSLGSTEAVNGASDVAVDGSASTGSALRYQVEFGDGTTAADKVSHHVYTAPGAFTIRVTVTDDTGRTSSATRTVTVATPLGRWVGAAYVEALKAVVVRTVVLNTQNGQSVSGSLAGGAREQPVSGTIAADRRIRLVSADQSETFEGVLPSVLSADGSSWDTSTSGGATLAFKRRVGEPSGPLPHAILQMRFFSFGAPFAVKQISPVRFDGSSSSGEGLTYFMEYGDGQVATEATSVHPLEKPGSNTARLTVVDRFGRSEVRTRDYVVRSLQTPGYYHRWENQGGDACGLHYLTIATQEGTTITGDLSDVYYLQSVREPYTGSITSDGQVHLQLDRVASTLDGTLTWPMSVDSYRNVMALTWAGGPCNGTAIRLYYRSGY